VVLLVEGNRAHNGGGIRDLRASFESLNGVVVRDNKALSHGGGVLTDLPFAQILKLDGLAVTENQPGNIHAATKGLAHTALSILMLPVALVLMLGVWLPLNLLPILISLLLESLMDFDRWDIRYSIPMRTFLDHVADSEILQGRCQDDRDSLPLALGDLWPSCLAFLKDLTLGTYRRYSTMVGAIAAVVAATSETKDHWS